MPIRFNLSKYKNPVFIETGTLHGEGVQSAIDAGFEKIYSIEISEKLYKEAFNRFHDEIKLGKVNIIHGDSSKELEKILYKENGLFTFWLDAHKDNPFVRDLNIECPLYNEISTIARHHKKTHTIIIDDIRLFGQVGTWAEDLSEIVLIQKIKQINPFYKVTFENGYIKGDVIIFFI